MTSNYLKQLSRKYKSNISWILILLIVIWKLKINSPSFSKIKKILFINNFCKKVLKSPNVCLTNKPNAHLVATERVISNSKMSITSQTIINKPVSDVGIIECLFLQIHHLQTKERVELIKSRSLSSSNKKKRFSMNPIKKKCYHWKWSYRSWLRNWKIIN